MLVQDRHGSYANVFCYDTRVDIIHILYLKTSTNVRTLAQANIDDKMFNLFISGLLVHKYIVDTSRHNT
jgi:hypothetical protein